MDIIHKKFTDNNSVENIKQLLNNTLKNLIKNCDYIITENISTELTVKFCNIKKDICSVIEWYSKTKTKKDVTDYLEDYLKLDRQFNRLVDRVPSDYYYTLSIIDSKFKFFKRSENEYSRR